MEPLIRMRLIAVRVSLALTMIAAAIGYAFEREIALGILMGGFAGVIAFWALAVHMEKLATASRDRVYWVAFKWSFMRLALYGIALWRAYELDRESLHGLLAAVAGLFVIRLVVVFLGLTGLDLDKERK